MATTLDLPAPPVKVRSCRMSPPGPACLGAGVPDPYNVLFKGTTCVPCVQHKFKTYRSTDLNVRQRHYKINQRWKCRRRLQQLATKLQALSSATSSPAPAVAVQIAKLGRDVEACRSKLSAIEAQLA